MVYGAQHLDAPRAAARSAVSLAPLPDRRDDLLGSILLDVVARALEDHRAVIREHRFPASALGLAEGDVLGGPGEQRGALAELGETALDLRQKRPAAEDLAREHVQRAA